MSTVSVNAKESLSQGRAPDDRASARLWKVTLIVICALAFILQLHKMWSFLTDDAFISLRYSQRLIEGHGLTWNDLPPRVEGYSNLLWVLICAGLGYLGMDLETAAKALGILSTAVGIAPVGFQAFRDFPPRVRPICALAGCMALCLSAPIAMWSVGGLEQPLLGAFLAWAAYFAIRWVSSDHGSSADTYATGLLLGFAVLTRADAALFTALFYAGAVAADGFRARSILMRARVIVLPLLVFAAQEIFRYCYYHDFVPETAYVKVAFTLHRLYTGLRFDIYGVGTNAAFFLLAVIGAVLLWRWGNQRQVLFLGTICIGWLSYIVIIGGDIFPGYRHFIPIMMLLGFLISGCGLGALATPGRLSPPRVTIVFALVILTLSSDLFVHFDQQVQQGRSVGLFLHHAFGDKNPLFASDAAGVMPFYSHFEAIDPLGLNDYHIAHRPTPDRGKGWVGHEMGDGPYVLDHKPDLVMSANFDGKMDFAADRQMIADPRFSKYYQLVFFNVGPPYPARAGMYVRRIDSKLGIEIGGNKVSVPAYLADRNDANSVRLIDGRAQLVIPPHGSAQFSRLPVCGNTWTSTLVGSDVSGLKVQSQTSSSITVVSTSTEPGTLASVELTCQNGSATNAFNPTILTEKTYK